MGKSDKECIMGDIFEKVLRNITPSQKERDDTFRFSSCLVDDLSERLHSLGYLVDIRIQGSIAKDTWLAEEKDIDVFILIPKTNRKKIFLKVLEVVKSFVGKGWVEAYAEHPYIQAKVEGYKIDFVPCFKIEKAEEVTSSVDRTPLHTSYVRRHVSKKTKSEIRLFKQFTRGIGVYGSEIKIRGLSGYLCELLILFYGSALKAFQGIASWRFGQMIDIENLYDGRIDKAKRFFNAPLIVIDPVDSTRNVAAVVSKDKLGGLIMSARLFLSKPEASFFFPDKTTAFSADTLNEKLRESGLGLVFISFRCGQTVPDVLWGQLYKTSRALRRLLTQNEFRVLKEATWSDEKEINVIVFGLEAIKIPRSKRHLGPPVDTEEAIPFIKKYSKEGAALIGPWIEEGRWMAVIKRRYVDAKSLLKEIFRSGAKDLGIASGLVEEIIKAKISVDTEILRFYASNEDFARFLTEFLKGRPKWID